MKQEKVYFVACPRKDKTQPKLVKAVDNVFFLERRDAEKLLVDIEDLLEVRHEIYEAVVQQD